ncbi:NAD(P)/FAD-dependent oxidoreductase [Allobranchiibius sp. GilTou38]|uniref:flavin-containing monooxygenase n=1 Tax=Allobranchiibius sp. GilTou38 TaxID=2815210 RepID=UPI0024419FE2|nr:NAD(P)/FAD-dependent oxidoreductase [Allobranchiibius sp. GilTou38]
MPDLKDHYDVVVVGAGLSGIDAGYRLQTMCPGRDYVILEARHGLGGTWDLFKYPGVRSDSDMYTLGFPFEPWTGDKSIADAADILDYLKSTAAKYGIDEHISYDSKLTDGDWSSEDAVWTLTVQTAGGAREVTANFVYMCSGYYNYEQGYTPEFPGREDFTGQVVHPQFWPEDLDVKGKDVVVIGSGATAVTLVPSLVELGARPTMLQRSPSYVIAQPDRDGSAAKLRKRLSAERAHSITRWRYVLATQGFYQFCRRMPKTAKKALRKATESQLKGSGVGIENFQPKYNPWDERLCVVPRGDLFRALREHTADIVTDTIDRWTPEGVKLSSGRVLRADIIVTATGLNMLAAGGAQLTVDGEKVDFGERYIYRGMMVEGVPNAAICIGYTNASWTLRADLSAQYFCKFVNHVSTSGSAYGYPTAHEAMRSRPAIDLQSGYVQRSIADFPKQGDRRPWFLRQNYVLDNRDTKRADLTQDMTYVAVGDVRTPNGDLHPSSGAA